MTHNGEKPRQPLSKIAVSKPCHQGCAPARLMQPLLLTMKSAKLDKPAKKKPKLAQEHARLLGSYRSRRKVA